MSEENQTETQDTPGAVEEANTDEANETPTSELSEEKTEEASAEASESEEEQAPQEERVLALGDTPDFKWYVAHVLSGHENKVTKTLKERILTHNLAESFAEILVPEESVAKSYSGKTRTIKKKFFPGYLLIKMIMNDKTWHLVKNTDKITGFVGASSSKPSPLSDEEAANITQQAQEGFSRPRSSVSFQEGDQVKVIEGPFASFIGTVEHIGENGKIKVQVSFFGRPTPVELDFSQVEKV